MEISNIVDGKKAYKKPRIKESRQVPYGCCLAQQISDQLHKYDPNAHITENEKQESEDREGRCPTWDPPYYFT